MCYRVFIQLMIILLCFVNGSCCVSVLEVHINPQIVHRGGEASIQCLYNFEEFISVYYVKWYIENKEFYRYTPGEKKKIKTFPFPGIYVDLSKSNSTQVSLQNIGLELAVTFKCEVSTDESICFTVTATARMEVVVLPEKPPIIVTNKAIYNPYDILMVKCSVPKSRPPVNLTLFIDNMKIIPDVYRITPIAELFQTELSVTILLLGKSFVDGPPTLICFSEMYDVYSEFSQLTLLGSNNIMDDWMDIWDTMETNTIKQQGNKNLMLLKDVAVVFIVIIMVLVIIISCVLCHMDIDE